MLAERKQKHRWAGLSHKTWDFLHLETSHIWQCKAKMAVTEAPRKTSFILRNKLSRHLPDSGATSIKERSQGHDLEWITLIWLKESRWRGRWDGGLGWGRRVNPRLIHVNVWQKTLQYCKVISLQLIKINRKKKKTGSLRDLTTN